jgi:hypothetical protein
MPHSVAPINVAVYNKGKGAFRRPTVREDHKGKGEEFYHEPHEQYDVGGGKVKNLSVFRQKSGGKNGVRRILRCLTHNTMYA